jgi:uncharacterized glyoxalase superfamily protein PhnB
MAKGLWPVINVSNVEKSVEFYKTLGIKARVDQMAMAEGMPKLPVGTIDLGESGIIIWGKHNLGPDQPEDTKAWVSGDLGKGVLFTVGVPNAQKIWANAQKIRAEIDTPLEAQPWGGHGFNLVDPDGYVLNITDKFPGMPAPKKKAAKKAKAVVRKVKKAVGKKRR